MPFTARELYLIGEAAFMLKSIAYAYQTNNQDLLKKLLGAVTCSVTVDERTKPQQWDVIYDKAHRYEPDHWVIKRKSEM